MIIFSLGFPHRWNSWASFWVYHLACIRSSVSFALELGFESIYWWITTKKEGRQSSHCGHRRPHFRSLNWDFSLISSSTSYLFTHTHSTQEWVSILAGMIMKVFGDWRLSRGRNPSFLASFIVIGWAAFSLESSEFDIWWLSKFIPEW